MDNYQGSEEHKQNIRSTALRGRLRIEELKLLRIEEYYKKPKLCSQCNSPIKYESKNNKFCSSSCAAKKNNKRVHSKESNLKTSQKVKKRVQNGTYQPPEQILSWKIKYTNCEICEKLFVQRSFEIRKTCSSDCRTTLIFKSRKYQNGKRKTILYVNKTQGEVLLESSWELTVAKRLDELNINWTRPNSIKWINGLQKEHLYYPDFHLTDYNIYLDPKNPYCMKLDEEKIEVVSRQINLIVGDLKKIIQFVNNLKQ